MVNKRRYYANMETASIVGMLNQQSYIERNDSMN